MQTEGKASTIRRKMARRQRLRNENRVKSSGHRIFAERAGVAASRRTSSNPLLIAIKAVKRFS
jgi:hypothetical protein